MTEGGGRHYNIDSLIDYEEENKNKEKRKKKKFANQVLIIDHEGNYKRVARMLNIFTGTLKTHRKGLTQQ